MTAYLQKGALYPPFFYKKASKNLGIIVVIPAYKEPYLLLSLMALKKCQLPLCDVEVIVLINDSEKDSLEVKNLNQKVFLQAQEWSKKNSKPRLRFRMLYLDNLPAKFAGVGLARKIGMDEACYRFEKIRQKKGIIACFDADSRCEQNYFIELEKHFGQNPRTSACSIYFEHPISGADHEQSVYEAIIAYELHLRYFIHAQRYAGCPFAYQTIGSSMAVRADHYQLQGGMNRRKAGEDFYFLHKFIALGNFTELKTTKVTPSPRISDRVPFGTGKAVGEIICKKRAFKTYNPLIFKDLKELFSNLNGLYKEAANWGNLDLPDSVQQFLSLHDFQKKLLEIHRNTSNFRAFKNRFFRNFNAFMVMKFAHFARDHFYENIEVREAAVWMLEQLGNPSKDLKRKDLLKMFRVLDRS